MPRRASELPTDVELEILQILWNSGPSMLGQICAALRLQRKVATTTVATMLKIMLDKKLVKRSPASRGSLWEAKLSRQAASAGLVRKLLDRVFDGSAEKLVAHLLEAGQLSDSDRQELRRLLDPNRRSEDS